MARTSNSDKLSDSRSPSLDPRYPRISIIVAMAKNGVIGAHNKLPWHLSSDLKRFKALTMGHHIIMGRKTFESIGRVLPGRTSVVVTRNPGFRFEGVLTSRSLLDALRESAGEEEVFVIGGEQIFREALPLATRLHATEIGSDYEGDTHFPAIDRAQWQETNAETFAEGEISGRFVTYDKAITV
jgi:dihydrofolate reductase